MSMIVGCEIYEQIYYLTQSHTKDWQQVLEIGESLPLDLKRYLLWVWPTVENLRKLRLLLKECNIDSILSIGCGNGLLEWILGESLNVEVCGLEIDRNWWRSPYAVKPFITLQFVDDKFNGSNDQDKKAFLQNCCNRENDWNFALLFCYFNNHKAFIDYLNVYEGNWLIIIGPADNNIHTDPAPLQPNFPTSLGKCWHLSKQLYISIQDIFALYKRVN